MSRLNEAKKRWDEAAAAGDIKAVERAAAVWKSVAEAEKLQLDAANLTRAARSENIRYWVPVIGSIVGTAALVGTLIFQMHQFNENSRLQREAAEDTQYRDALKSMQDPRMMNAVVGFPQFKTFLDSPRYGKQAREVAIGLLRGIIVYDRFRYLFDALVARTTWEDFDDIVAANRDVWTSFTGWDTRLERMEADKAAGRPDPVAAPPPGFRTPPFPQFPGAPGEPGEPRFEDDGPLSLEQVRRFRDTQSDMLLWSSKSLAGLVRRLPRQNAKALDFTDAYLGESDLGGLELSNATLIGTAFYAATLTGTDLSDAIVTNAHFANVTKFDRSNWRGVAWWRARNMSPGLLEYLTKTFPFDPAAKYASDAAVSRDDYAKDVERLRAGLAR